MHKTFWCSGGGELQFVTLTVKIHGNLDRPGPLKSYRNLSQRGLLKSRCHGNPPATSNPTKQCSALGDRRYIIMYTSTSVSLRRCSTSILPGLFRPRLQLAPQMIRPHHPILRTFSSISANTHKSQRNYKPSHDDTTTQIRLSKRMSELGICSRREAARILKEANETTSDLKYLKEIIYVRGEPVTEGTGVKVSPNEKRIEIKAGDSPIDEDSDGSGYFVPYAERPWDEIRGDTIVLNKPIGYVSGQEEHQHIPAVRLLTRANLYLEDGDDETKETLSMGTALHFSRKKWNGFDLESSTIPRHIRKNIAGVDDKKSKSDKWFDEATLSGYATAGRLDIDSTGVIIFTRAGIMARRLIAPDTKIPKEYIVKVQPAVQPTTREKEAGLLSLPSPTRNLTSLLRGGKRLWNDKKALKPVLEAEWLEENPVLSNGGTLRLVLQEGKKRQIRRMCREILGMHVVSLVRKSIGPIQLDTLPEGKWRPLKEQEVREIFADTPHKKRKKAKRFVGKD